MSPRFCPSKEEACSLFGRDLDLLGGLGSYWVVALKVKVYSAWSPLFLLENKNKSSSFRGEILMLLLYTFTSFSFAGSSSMSYKEDHFGTNNLGK